MRRLRGFLALGAITLVATLAACSRKHAVAPPPPVAPAVVTVQPPARSAGYAYDGQIWARFDRALDAGTVDTTTVFLKQDTKRIPCTVAYEPGSRRIVIAPRTPLALGTTYTVVLSTRIVGKDGAALAADYFWQFSTSSIRRPVYLNPVPGEIATRVAMLSWSSESAVPGTLVFDVHAGDDSLAVLARTAPLLYRGPNAFWLPRTEWPAGRRVFWALTTTNSVTGERYDSPVAGFDVVPDDLPTHVVNVPALEWGGSQLGSATQFCTQSYIPAGSIYRNAVRFDLDPARQGNRVKSARLVMYAQNNAGVTPFVSAWACSPTWVACAFSSSAPPYQDTSGALATATFGSAQSEMNWSSVALAAWAEGMLRRGDFSGLMFTNSSTTSLRINTNSTFWPRPVLELTVYD